MDDTEKDKLVFDVLVFMSHFRVTFCSLILCINVFHFIAVLGLERIIDKRKFTKTPSPVPILLTSYTGKIDFL